MDVPLTWIDDERRMVSCCNLRRHRRYYSRRIVVASVFPQNVSRPLLYMNGSGRGMPFRLTFTSARAGPSRYLVESISPSYSSAYLRPLHPEPQVVEMTIPVYRHNLDNDDWEVASVYDSDDCESLGRSGYDDGSIDCAGSLDDPVLRLQSILQDETRPRPGFRQQQQRQKYASATASVPRWDTRYGHEKLGSFASPLPPIVPPPGIIFPPQDWVYPPRDAYMPPVNGQTAPDPDVGLIELPPGVSLAPPPPPSRSPSPLMRRPSPSLIIPHGQTPHSTSGTGNKHASPIMPPPLYHELPTHLCLADPGRQAPPGMTMTSPSRRTAHEILPSYAGPAQLPRGHSREDFVQDVHYSPIHVPGGGSGGLSPHLSYGSGERVEALQASGPVNRGYDPGRNASRTRIARSQTRERRPSIWQRFVRRFSPSRVSVGQS